MKKDFWRIRRLMQVVAVLIFVDSSESTSAAVLTLLSPNTLPVPSGADHIDSYQLPPELNLSNGDPITQIEIDYRNSPFVTGIGIHEIKSAAFLFDSGDLASTTIFESTTERFWARIVFKTSPDRRLTGLQDRFAPAFAAYHGSVSGGATTGATWTVTYESGIILTANNGIIPETCSSGFLVASATLLLLVRKKTA